MPQKGFLMYLKRGAEKEYKIRHDNLWPELQALLKAYGISNYSFFLDSETGILFASLDCPENYDENGLAKEAVMQKWWGYMEELMETESNAAPKTKPLEQVFYLK